MGLAPDAPSAARVVIWWRASCALALQVLSDVLSSTGLTLSGLRTLQLTRKDAEDYLEAYKGVVAEYSRWGVLSPAPPLAPLPRTLASRFCCHLCL